MYEVFQRIYCLSPIVARYEREELITAMADFLICRIMYVILLFFIKHQKLIKRHGLALLFKFDHLQFLLFFTIKGIR